MRSAVHGIRVIVHRGMGDALMDFMLITPYEDRSARDLDLAGLTGLPARSVKVELRACDTHPHAPGVDLRVMPERLAQASTMDDLVDVLRSAAQIRDWAARHRR